MPVSTQKKLPLSTIQKFSLENFVTPPMKLSPSVVATYESNLLEINLRLLDGFFRLRHHLNDEEDMKHGISFESDEGLDNEANLVKVVG